MDRKKVRNLLRQGLHTPALYTGFNGVFTVLLSGIVLLTLFCNANVYYPLRWYALISAACLGLLVSFILSRTFAFFPEPSPLQEGLAAGFLLVLLLAFQGLVGSQLHLTAGLENAQGMVMQRAVDYATTGADPGSYLLHFPGDGGLYVILSGLFSLLHGFGVQDFTMTGLALTMLAVDVSVLLLYLCSRRLFGPNRALLVLLGCILVAPLALCIPLCTATTLAMPFPIAMVFLWLGARNKWRQGMVKAAVWRFCLLSLLAALGALIKLPVLVVWVAILLDLLLLLSGKGRALLAFAGLGIAAGFLVLGGLGVHYAPSMPVYDANDTIPLSGWVMMGLSSRGEYNTEDYQAIAELDGREARSAYVGETISQRLNEMGPLAFLNHLGTKLSRSFGEGTLGTAGVLEGDTDSALPLQSFFTVTGSRFSTTAYLAFAAFAALLIWGAVAAGKSVYRKNNALTFVRVALLGQVVLLLVFEGGAKHLLFLLPLFLLCAVEASPPGLAASSRPAPQEEPALETEPAFDPPAPGPDYMDPDFALQEPPLQEGTSSTSSEENWLVAEEESQAPPTAAPPAEDESQAGGAADEERMQPKKTDPTHEGENLWELL